MKLIQTQYPLANISPDGSRKGMLAFMIILIAGTAVGIYLINNENRKRQIQAVNQNN